MRKKLELQLFTEGENGSTNGGSASEGVTNNGNTIGGATNTGNTISGSYTHEQLEEIANARSERASRAALADFFRKQGMEETQITTAIQDYKEKAQASKPNVGAIEKERDEALQKVEQYEQEKLLTSLRVGEQHLEFVLFKVGKMVNEKKDFATAAKEFLKANAQYTTGGYRVSTGSTNTGAGGQTPNEVINSLIRTTVKGR